MEGWGEGERGVGRCSVGKGGKGRFNSGPDQVRKKINAPCVYPLITTPLPTNDVLLSWPVHTKGIK